MTVTISDLAQALDAEFWGDGNIVVTGAGEPQSVGAVTNGAGRVALAMSPAYATGLVRGSVAMIAQGMDPEALGLAAAVIVARPRLAMAGLTRSFDPGAGIAPGIHPQAIIDPSAEIGDGAAIAPFVVIGAGVRIGAGARIASHVSIGAGVHIGTDALLHAGARIQHNVNAGDRLIVHPNAVIGADGFSFVTPEESGVERARKSLGDRGAVVEQHWLRIHSLGGVVLGDDVEVGAGSMIDSGTIRPTSIGSGTKLDNLVHVGHNVQVGHDSLLCGQVGIAGSARIGNRVVLGGQCGVSDNIFIGDDVVAGGASKIFTNVPAGRVILGSPATKMDTQIEMQKAARRLPRLAAQLAELQKIVTKLSEKG